MLQFIMDQNLLLYICGVACAVGVVSQFLLRHLYERLTGEIPGYRRAKKDLSKTTAAALSKLRSFE